MTALHDFASIWLSILFEAVPFVLLGALVGGFMEALMPGDVMKRWTPRNPLLAAMLGAGAGVMMPMCECGVIPVVRRLVRKGVPPHAAVAYMLAAPIVNPIVALSTFVAFRAASPWAMTGLRVGLGFTIAVTAAMVFRAFAGAAPMLDAEAAAPRERLTWRQAIPEALRHAGRDFIEITAILAIGAAIAAALNAWVPREAVRGFAGNHVAATLAMMALAVALNLCSEADAFVAWSLGDFSLAARLGFLVLGPMLDMKLVAMYTRVFRPRTIILLTTTVVVLVFVAVVAVGYAWPALRVIGSPLSP